MKTVKIDKTYHRGQEVVLIQFPYDDKLGLEVRKIKSIRWSKNLRAWYAPYSIEVLNEIKIILEPIAIIDAQALKDKVAKKREIISQKKELKAETIKQIEKFVNWLHSRRYSENTIKTYSDALRSFLLYFHKKEVTEISNDDVIDYNNHFILANHLSSSYQNQVVNAIKLFFRTIQGMKIDVDLIHRPKREKLLPNVLSKEEIKLILNAHCNIKHRAMLSLIYSCGLRCGELLSLKPEHIDSNRLVVIIKQAKGRKDRIAPLSGKIDQLLKEYIILCKPSIYLFEGQKKGDRYDARSLQLVLKQGLEKAKIKKPVSLHWLRHSYATHLLENGTDLRYIQEILGHSSSKTTEIYTHVSTKNIQKIVSPFDYL